MLNIPLSPEAAARFKELLAEEDNEDAVFRIREVKVGMACKSHMELRMGIDEREDEDEEQGNKQCNCFESSDKVFVHLRFRLRRCPR